MMNELSAENELWDDDCLDGVGPITHNGCGGRIFLIQQEEFRCIRCLSVVDPDLMEISCGATANEK
jgi:hypothetical protein